MKPLRSVFLFSALTVMAFAVPPRKMRIFLVGDSTMADKQVNAFPETGWGMSFKKFFDTSTTVVYNEAQNGRSTKSFMSEHRWVPIVDSLEEGDIVLIQFGHNDEVRTKVQSTTEQEFQDNLAKYIDDTRSKKAIPVLITPVARRSFDNDGKLQDTHKIYSELVRGVAAKKQVTLVELDRKSQALLQTFGPENSRWLFNHLEPGEHPNYPQGNADNTHFSEFGARKMAEIVFAELKALNPGGIAEHFYKPAKKQ